MELKLVWEKMKALQMSFLDFKLIKVMNSIYTCFVSADVTVHTERKWLDVN